MKKHSIFFFDFDGTLADTRESLVPVYRAGFDLIGMHVSEKQCAHFIPGLCSGLSKRLTKRNR